MKLLAAFAGVETLMVLTLVFLGMGTADVICHAAGAGFGASFILFFQSIPHFTEETKDEG